MCLLPLDLVLICSFSVHVILCLRYNFSARNFQVQNLMFGWRLTHIVVKSSTQSVVMVNILRVLHLKVTVEVFL